uniref:Uncharacterized protein n=1 Tax=mine drainage metagenome TaxID=410659 RepID=E6PIV2_9ZZZZ
MSISGPAERPRGVIRIRPEYLREMHGVTNALDRQQRVQLLAARQSRCRTSASQIGHVVGDAGDAIARRPNAVHV